MRTRTVAAALLGLVTVVLVGLGLWTVYGFAVEYGSGAFTDLAFLVVPIPVLVAAVAVASWPRGRTATRVAVVVGTAVLMVGGGFAADALGAREKQEQLVADSESFTCNGPNAEIVLPPEIDETWAELPREAPVYGPIEGSRTDCTAAVSGDGEQTYADYTDAFRDLDGWTVEVDRPQRFVMTRDGVEVEVRLVGAPDRLTTIRVGVVS